MTIVMSKEWITKPTKMVIATILMWIFTKYDTSVASVANFKKGGGWLAKKKIIIKIPESKKSKS